MLKFLGKYIGFETLKNIATLMTGTVVSIAIPIITAPISSRIFNSTHYGVLGAYMAISSLISVLAYAHYQHGIMLEKEDEGARQMVWVTVTFSLAVAILTGLVLLALSLLTHIIQKSEVGWWFLFLPVSALCNGITSCLLLWANRIKQYKQLAANRVIQSISTVVIQIGLGLLIPNETGLLVGFIAGQALSAGLLVWRFYINKEHSIGVPQFSQFRGYAIKYKGLLFYSAPSEFINTFVNQSPVLLLQQFAGISAVGYFNFSQRLLGLPQTVLSSAIVEVFRQKAASEYSTKGNCRPVFLKTAKALILISIVPFLILFFFAPQIFAFVFGENWREAGVISQYLGVLFFFRFIVSPLTYVYTIAGRYREDFIMHILMMLVIFGSFYIGATVLNTDRQLILSYSLCYSFFYLIYFFRSYQLTVRPI